jgi:hypothetical protein
VLMTWTSKQRENFSLLRSQLIAYTSLAIQVKAC